MDNPHVSAYLGIVCRLTFILTFSYLCRPMFLYLFGRINTSQPLINEFLFLKSWTNALNMMPWLNASMCDRSYLSLQTGIERGFIQASNSKTDGSSNGVVVRGMGHYEMLSGHQARPVPEWVALIVYPVPNHYTCEAVRPGFRNLLSWLRMRR